MSTFLTQISVAFLPHDCVARTPCFWESDCRSQCVDASYPQRRTPNNWRSIVRHSDTDKAILLQCLPVFLHLWDLQPSFTFPGRPDPIGYSYDAPSFIYITTYCLGAFSTPGALRRLRKDKSFSGRYFGYCCFTTFYQLLNMVSSVLQYEEVYISCNDMY
jgi:hypothetical protein